MEFALKEEISRYAVSELGFDDCRFASPRVDAYLKEYRQWLSEGRHAGMEFLQRHLPFKENPGLLLNGVRSAMVVIKNYKNTPEKRLSHPLKISRYAVGKDYHQVMGAKLEQLAAYLTELDPSAQCYAGVDSRPLAERSLALAAGIGFRGKNTMVIKPGLGSYFFIGVILTTADLKPDQPLVQDCGSCRLCLDACPTGALTQAYQLDAKRCISYANIEQKEPLSPDQLKTSKGWLFGCDICQEACPYNNPNTPLTNWPALMPSNGVGFDVFQRNLSEESIPEDTPLHRSRKRVVPNWQNARASGG